MIRKTFLTSSPFLLARLEHHTVSGLNNQGEGPCTKKLRILRSREWGHQMVAHTVQALLALNLSLYYHGFSKGRAVFTADFLKSRRTA